MYSYCILVRQVTSRAVATGSALPRRFEDRFDQCSIPPHSNVEMGVRTYIKTGLSTAALYDSIVEQCRSGSDLARRGPEYYGCLVHSVPSHTAALFPAFGPTVGRVAAGHSRLRYQILSAMGGINYTAEMYPHAPMCRFTEGCSGS